MNINKCGIQIILCILYLGMRVMLKLVPNHSSTSDLMFERSVLKEPLYKDYYIWNPGFSVGVNNFPINNWVGINKYIFSKI